MNIRAVFVLILFLLLAACAASPPEAAPPTTSVSPAVTAAPAVPTPTLTPEPTAVPTLTADQLRDLRATAVLTTLPGYDPARHDALLPLARALWGNEDVIDPADVAIVVGETAVRVNADATGSYLPGTLFLWRGAELLLLLPTAPDQTIEPGQVTLPGETVQTWVAYDGAGALARFLHPAAAQWITPLDLSETGSFTLFLAQDISPDGQPGAATVWWANGGQPVELATSPNPGQSLPDYLTATQHQLTHTTVEDQQLSAIAASDGTIQYTYNAETGTWQEVNNYAPAAADLPRYVEQAQELMQYDDIVLTAENARINPQLGRMEYYDQNGVLAAYSAITIDDQGRITHLVDDEGQPRLFFAATEQLQARSHQMPVTYNGQQIETKVQVHFDHPRLMNAGLVVGDGELNGEGRLVDSVYTTWEQLITGLLQTGQIVANSLNPDPNTPHFLTTDERLRLRESGTFHFYVNFYDQKNPTLRGINPSPAYRPHVSSGAAGPISYYGYYYDPIRNELHATKLMSDAFLDQYLQWRLLSYISQPMAAASFPNPETVKTGDYNWMSVPTNYRQASDTIMPPGPPSQYKVSTSNVGQ